MVKPPPYLGATFHKTDFQVHSLRDINWKGPFHRINDREKFAQAMVAHARKAGLSAIAITDHHDLCFWPYLRDAAAQETDDAGVLYPPEDRLTVFPGVEVTLSTPLCQVLLLLDPDLPEKTVDRIWGALKVIPTESTNKTTTVTETLETDRDLATITKDIGDIRTNAAETNPAKFEYLDGRFILLPNVKRGGHKTITREGFQDHYADSPFCGGYIEKVFYKDLDQGNLNIVEGRDKAWGSKAVGVFQTSDCRSVVVSPDGASLTFEGLGEWPTWVKWAVSSAEALRQACLAKASRISQVEPAYPLLQVVGIVVSDSEFLGQVQLGLSPQFNSFIGGRGTGKSSVLEYIRWALCDDPLGNGTDESELPNFEARRKALVEQTLRPMNATVTVFYKRNDVLYSIERNVATKDGTCVVTASNGDKETLRPTQIRQQFPILSYAQKQLSSVGTLPDEIHRLVTDPIKEQLEAIDELIEDELLPALRQQALNRRRLADLDAEISGSKTTNKNRRDQIKALQAQLQSLTPEQQKVVDEHELVAEIDTWKRRTEENPAELERTLSDALSKAQSLQDVIPPQTLPGNEDLKKLADASNQFLKKVIPALEDLIREAQDHRWISEGDRDALQAIDDLIANHNEAYQLCIAENTKNQKHLDEIQKLNTQVSTSEATQITKEAERATLKASLDKLANQPMENLTAAAEARGALLENQCKTIFEQAQHGFRPVLKRMGDPRQVRNAIASIIDNRNVKDGDAKTDALAKEVLTATNPLEKWQEVILELDTLVNAREAATSPTVKMLESAGFTSANIDSLRKGLPLQTVDQNRFFNIADRVEFEFKRGVNLDGTDKYVPFISASPGQQATCLLETLLAQDGAPLLIDQPEEDLDNEQIQRVSDKIMTTKTLRQLIFVSHNANLVVNGDAELVACFRHDDQSDKAGCRIAPIGSIDCEPVRKTITAVMEGGKRAFELRKEKYRF
jgi:chromosome segregation protein